MSIYQRFAKNLGIVAIGQILVSLGGIIMLPLLTKSLGAGDYGLWVQVEATASLVVLLSGLGLPYALNRFLASERESNRIRDIFYSTATFTLASTIFMSVLLLVFSSSLADLFFGGNIDVVLLAIVIIPVRSLWWVYLNYVRAFQEMDKYTAITVFQKYGVIVLSSLLIYLGYGLIGAVSSLIITFSVTLLILAFLVARRIGISRPAFGGFKDLLRFSLPTVPSNMSHWVVDLSDRYVIGAILGVVALGYYSSAYVLGSISILLNTFLSIVLPSTLSKLYDERKTHELKNHLAYSLRLFLIMSIPFAFGNLALSKTILTILSTAEIANNSYLVAVIISIGGIFFGIYGVIVQILIITKKTKLIAVAWGISAIVNLSLTIGLVPLIGVLGAAIATSLSYFLACILTGYFSFKEMTFTIEARFIVKCIISSAIMYAIVSLLSPSGAIQTILVVILGIAIYFLLMIILRGIKKEEINIIKELIKSVKK